MKSIMRKKGIPSLEGAEKTRFTYILIFFYMESKNVQKTRFSAGLKTKSLYMVIEKMFKTHVEEFGDFTNFLSINKNNNVVLKTMID
jgi:hypothetical protein